jgi:deoxyribodipyrimidine photolyase-related protein
MYAVWDRMDTDKRQTIIAEGDDILARLDAGEPV